MVCKGDGSSEKVVRPYNRPYKLISRSGLLRKSGQAKTTFPLPPPLLILISTDMCSY